MAEEYRFSDLEKAFFTEYLKLPPTQRTVMNNYLERVVAAVNEMHAKQLKVVSSAVTESEAAESAIELELEAYRKELEAEQKGKKFNPSDAQNGA